jgi:hypothetical protein
MMSYKYVRIHDRPEKSIYVALQNYNGPHPLYNAMLMAINLGICSMFVHAEKVELTHPPTSSDACQIIRTPVQNRTSVPCASINTLSVCKGRSSIIVPVPDQGIYKQPQWTLVCVILSDTGTAYTDIDKVLHSAKKRKHGRLYARGRFISHSITKPTPD